MKYRCDKIFHCEDLSDEEDCDYFEVDVKSYNKKYPPISIQKGTEVKVHLDIQKFKNIKELDMSFDAKVTLTLEWFDSRLTYRNLLDAAWPNIIKQENKDQVWIPPLVFNNTYENIMVRNEENSILFIKKRGNHTNAPLTSINEDFYYKGSENILALTIEYDLTFQCEFQLQGYPFDTQVCMIEVNTIFIHIYCLKNNDIQSK